MYNISIYSWYSIHYVLVVFLFLLSLSVHVLICLNFASRLFFTSDDLPRGRSWSRFPSHRQYQDPNTGAGPGAYHPHCWSLPPPHSPAPQAPDLQTHRETRFISFMHFLSFSQASTAQRACVRVRVRVRAYRVHPGNSRCRHHWTASPQNLLPSAWVV